MYLSSPLQQFNQLKKQLEPPPLLTACEQGNLAEVEKLLKPSLLGKKTDVNQTNEVGWTALHIAAKYNQLPVLEKLFACGGNIHAKAEYGRQPLHMACFNGNAEIAQWLIEKGVGINALAEHERTGLHDAAFNGHEKVMKVSNTYAKDKAQNTPLEDAVMQGFQEIVIMILDHRQQQNKHGLYDIKLLKNLIGLAQKYQHSKLADYLIRYTLGAKKRNLEFKASVIENNIEQSMQQKLQSEIEKLQQQIQQEKQQAIKAIPQQLENKWRAFSDKLEKQFDLLVNVSNSLQVTVVSEPISDTTSNRSNNTPILRLL